MRIRRIAANDFKQLQSIDLHLPLTGRFLVQGKNEAGKSTLFEALYFGLFGKGLTGRGNEDLVGYAKEKARVELWVEARDKLYKIERTLTRGKSTVNQSAVLTIETQDGKPPEVLTQARAVSNRLALDFGFNGEDLLNTCFVEQKKLDKLEGVDRQKREESLMRLLNLETLTDMERAFRITPDERRTLDYQVDKLNLARAREDLPQREARRAAVEQELHLAAARDSLADTLAQHAESHRQATEIDRLRRLEEDLLHRESQLKVVQEAGQALREFISALEQVERERAEVHRLSLERHTAQAAAQALPALEHRAARLRRLATRLSRLDRVSRRHETAQAQAQQREREAQTLRERQAERDTALSRLDALDTQVVAARTALEQAEQSVQAWHERAVLHDWREAYLAATSPQRAQAELADRQAERVTLRQTFDTEIQTFLVNPPRTMDALLDAVRGLLTRLGELFSQVDTVAHRAGYLEGSSATLVQRAAADQKRLATLEDRLRKQGASIPASLDDADARLAHLTTVVAERDQAHLQTAANTARDLLAGLGGQREETQRKLDQLGPIRASALADAEHAAQQATQQAAKAGRIVTTWRPHVLTALDALSLTPERLDSALRETEYSLRDSATQVARLPQLEAEQRDRDRRIATHEASMMELHPRILAVEASLPDLTPTIRLDDVQPALVTLRTRFQSLGGERLRQDLRDTTSALGSAQEKRDQAQRRQAEALQTAHDRLHAARLAELLPTLDLESVQAAHARLAEFNLDAQALEVERGCLMGEIGGLKRQRDELEQKLGLRDTELDVETCENELGRLRREHSVREHARDIVAKARERIVKKIMPHTMEYMQRILPQLTSGRYMMAQLTDDYKITVLDERAGDKGEFKSKDIFSGGCRDQLSLALRLSFALATLPAERGGAPRFIFLDEPLSAFDDERADALLFLLTEGEVSQAFDQIFLISHGRVDESAFTYRIRLEGGRVIEHDIPIPASETEPQPSLQF